MAHPSPAVDLFGALASTWLLFALVSALLLGYALPLMALVVTLNIRRIRKELQQLNETLSMPSRRL